MRSPVRSVSLFSAPLLPLRDAVHFPGLIHVLHVAREGSKRALRYALEHGSMVVCVSQRDMAIDDPKATDLFDFGVAAEVMQATPLPDGSLRVALRALERVLVRRKSRRHSFLMGSYAPVAESGTAQPVSLQATALIRHVIDQFARLVELNSAIPAEAMAGLPFNDRPGSVADTVAHHLPIGPIEKQVLLEDLDAMHRLDAVRSLVERELEIWSLRRELSARVDGSLGQSHREFLLREQLRAIQIELGDDPFLAEIQSYRQSMAVLNLPKDVFESIERELGKLERFGPGNPDSAMSRAYLEALLEMPWHESATEEIDLKRAADILNEHHWGLEGIKERILEFLAVQKLTGRNQNSILCFVGPPGVGKTSVAHSIASAMGRPLVQISLAGIRDEAELRGHRRTYVGSMPGRIAQAMRKAGARNPVILLDEIDKMSRDFRGDPSSVLLEAFDPSLHKAFSDHYLDVPLDLSEVVFITTANLVDGILPALKDRLEIVPFHGYSDRERVDIATKFLIPKTLVDHGFEPETTRFEASLIEWLVALAGNESGLRPLEKRVAHLCRKLARDYALSDSPPPIVTLSEAVELLGEDRRSQTASAEGRVGVCTGLAVGELGGSSLEIEALHLPRLGKEPNLILTGNLGDVMRESAVIALSICREQLSGEIMHSILERDLHIHVGDGGVPKDGPSAGLALLLALWSALSETPIPGNVAAMGEITLRGRLRAVGGVRQKSLAALRSGIQALVLPVDNKIDIDQSPAEVRDGMRMHYVNSVEEAMDWVRAL